MAYSLKITCFFIGSNHLQPSQKIIYYSIIITGNFTTKTIHVIAISMCLKEQFPILILNFLFCLNYFRGNTASGFTRNTSYTQYATHTSQHIRNTFPRSSFSRMAFVEYEISILTHTQICLNHTSQLTMRWHLSLFLFNFFKRLTPFCWRIMLEFLSTFAMNRHGDGLLFM